MKQLISIALLLFSFSAQAGIPPTTSKGIGDTSDLTTFKFKFPNMTVSHSGSTVTLGGGLTTTQKLAIASPTAGMQVYDTTLNFPSYYDGSTWQNGLGTITIDTDWTACTFSTLAWQGLGTVTNTSLQCRRQGPNLEIKGVVTLGTVTASTIQIPLPNNYGTLTTQSGNALDSYGTLIRGVASPSQFSNLIATVGLGYFQVSGPAANAVSPTTASAGTSNYANSDTVIFRNISIPIQGWTSNANTFSAANANTDWASYTPTFTGFGTVSTSNMKWRRSGGSLEIDGTFVIGTPSATEQRISFPNSLISASSITVLENAGEMNSSANLGSIFKLIVLKEPSVGYMTFGSEASGTAGLLKTTTAGPYPSAGAIMAVKAIFPITGWSNVSSVAATVTDATYVIGSVSTKMFGANVTTTSGTIALPKGGIITTCTAANPTVCSFSGLTTTPLCQVTVAPYNTTSVYVRIGAQSSSSVSIQTTSTATGVDTASVPVNLSCFGN